MAWLVAGLWLLGSVPAVAQDRDEEARRHFRIGQAHYLNGSFQDAAREFEEAYRLSNRPQLLYNVFVAHRDAGNLQPATEALRRYLELVPDAEEHDQLRARLANMERLLASQGTSTGTNANTDTGPDSGSGSDSDSGSDSGSGSDSDSGPDSSAGSVTTDATPTTTEEPRVDPHSARRPSIVPWVVVAGGGAFLIAAGITGLVTVGIESDLEDQCGADLTCPADLRDDAETGKTLAVATDVLLATAVVTAGIGFGLMILMDGTDEEEAADADASPEASAGCGPDGCSASLRVRF